MISFFKECLHFFLIPTNVFWLLIIFAGILRNRKKILAFRILVFALGWLFLTGTRWIPDLLVYGLEKQYNVLDPDSTMKGLPILVLGGGSVYDEAISPQDRLSANSMARMLEGMRLFHEINSPALIFSGNSPSSLKSQAAITRDAALALGIQENSIHLLEQPTTTEEEAVAFSREFGNRYDRFILVTSDIHMPRAMYIFKQMGLQPIPAPGDPILRSLENTDKTKFMRVRWWKSYKNNFDKFTAAMHEYIGLLWAKI